MNGSNCAACARASSCTTLNRSVTRENTTNNVGPLLPRCSVVVPPPLPLLCLFCRLLRAHAVHSRLLYFIVKSPHQTLTSDINVQGKREPIWRLLSSSVGVYSRLGAAASIYSWLVLLPSSKTINSTCTAIYDQPPPPSTS